MLRAVRRCSPWLSYIQTLRKSSPVIHANSWSRCLSTFNTIRLEEKHGFPLLLLNRPPVNAFNTQFLVEVQQALGYLEKNSSNGVILSSALPSTFSAGLDFSEIYQRTKEDVGAFWREVQKLWLKLYSFPRPVVAAINGHCLAGGGILIGCADYRVASSAGSYQFGVPAARLGMTAPVWFLKTLVSIIGQRQTELIVSKGEVMRAERALDIGLVDELCEPGLLLERSAEILKSFSEVDQATQTRMKLLLRHDLLQGMEQAMKADMEQFVEWTCREETQELLAAVNKKLKK